MTDLKQFEAELDRQWNESRLQADDILDEWLLAKPGRRIEFIECTVWLREHDRTLHIFAGIKPSDARAQAAMALRAEDFK
jgi:hypothetical protein